MFFDADIQEINRRLKNQIRVGRVSEVDNKGNSLVRVSIGGGDFVTDFIPLLQIATPVCAVWVAPKVGEQVVFLSTASDPGVGVALRGIYHRGRKEPETRNEDNAVISFADGTFILYDNKSHRLEINASGADVTVKASTVTAHSDDITLGGGAVTGVVTQQCNCIISGTPHIDGSAKVKAVK